MANRPYLQSRIDDLEKIFKDHKNDRSICLKLLDELKHRKTSRATSRASKLKIKIERHINSGSQTPETPTATIPTQTTFDFPETEIPKNGSSANTPTTPSPPITVKPKPPIQNRTHDILRAWTALEVLSPNGYRNETDLVGGQKSCIARFSNTQLPWELGEKSRPKKRLYYELILGSISMPHSIESLLKVYSDNRVDMPSTKQNTPIASILLDKNGCPLEENSTVISSFAWGFPVALNGNLELLSEWPKKETELLQSFSKALLRRDENGDIIPLNKDKIYSLHSYLTKILNLEKHKVTPPYFALRKYHFFASKTPPEHSLLNSFYLSDLSAAMKLTVNNSLPKALKYYLNYATPRKRFDLLQNNNYVQHLLQPALTPHGRWPGKGRFPLTLLQQTAVNATSTKLTETGLLGVNGPPGTGKTTLLRDIVAARIIERSSVMAGYNDPETAFQPTKQTLKRNGATITLFELDDQLKGHEIVVASSNNKAVENVSTELPSVEAIADDATKLRYFKSISDNVLEKETWGLIAAVLGNSSNRFHFSQKFWHDIEYGMSAYLNHASGVPQIVSEPQTDAPPKKRFKYVVTQEQAPNNKHEALIRWNQTKDHFKRALQASQTNQSTLQKIHKQLVSVANTQLEIKNSTPALKQLEDSSKQLQQALHSSTQAAQVARQTLENLQTHINRHKAQRPGFIARLFRTKTAKCWRNEETSLLTQIQASKIACTEKNDQEHKCKQDHTNVKHDLEHQRVKTSELKKQLSNLQEQINKSCQELNVPIPNTAFFSQRQEIIQIANLWFDREANILRDQVFESAIALHKAFIDCAAVPLKQNLSIFTESFGTRSLGTPQKDALISDLWASFFLVVPVVSTTFASINKMFSRINNGSIGWLLIDEAGQALPQAAVGAIMRSQRTIAVGDPLQIEPVVTLPNQLTEEICEYFGVGPSKYNAPEASVQTTVDSASIYYSRFPTGNGYRNVGAPLLVHRRCDSPMFDISNEIAYSNLMTQAKKPSNFNNVLGPSGWYDIAGKPGRDKWCEDEGHELIRLLKKLRLNAATPDFYIVTPFVIVQNNIREVLRNSNILNGWVANPENWVNEHVGTIHTVQGREADIVFFVLGAQASNQNGARNWAGTRPNLVNVAVTRAKSSIYIIGNRMLWKSVGVFQTLDKFLPQK